MSKNNGWQTVGSLAHFVKALMDILRAFMQGGWAAAALQALKHYWPQILAIALVLILLPTILFCCMPMVLFGIAPSGGAETSAESARLEVVNASYDNYALYLEEWIMWIQTTVTAQDDGEQNTETDATTSEEAVDTAVEYEVVITGSQIQKNWFVALHTVTVGNDLRAVTETDIRDFALQCLSYTVTPADENTETGDETTSTSEEEVPRMVLTIHHRSPEEIMTACGFTDADKSWAQLIYQTLESPPTNT